MFFYGGFVLPPDDRLWSNFGAASRCLLMIGVYAFEEAPEPNFFRRGPGKNDSLSLFTVPICATYAVLSEVSRCTEFPECTKFVAQKSWKELSIPVNECNACGTEKLESAGASG
jgi:hypothetical protein